MMCFYWMRNITHFLWNTNMLCYKARCKEITRTASKCHDLKYAWNIPCECVCCINYQITVTNGHCLYIKLCILIHSSQLVSFTSLSFTNDNHQFAFNSKRTKAAKYRMMKLDEKPCLSIMLRLCLQSVSGFISTSYLAPLWCSQGEIVHRRNTVLTVSSWDAFSPILLHH